MHPLQLIHALHPGFVHLHTTARTMSGNAGAAGAAGAAGVWRDSNA
jgi:hypothetical protein